MPTLRTNIEKKLWKLIDEHRGDVEVSEFKLDVLGLLFLRFLSYSFDEFYRKLKKEGLNPETKEKYEAKNIFWLPKETRWAYLVEHVDNSDIGETIDHAMDMIEGENESLLGVLPKSYSRPELRVVNLSKIVDGLSFQVDDETIFSSLFDYFLEQFAIAIGTDGGEFYIPKSIASLLTEMLRPVEGKVFDPACGSGGMLVQSKAFIEKQEKEATIEIYGQEKDKASWKLAKMSLAVRGIDADLGSRARNPFLEDEHEDLKADYILTNVPFNSDDWGGEKLQADKYWEFGIPPERNANYAWVQHIISKLAPAGTAGFVLANSSMSTNMTAEYLIRKNIVDEDLVECIVTLPGQLLHSTLMPVCLWFVSRNKASNMKQDRSGEILFIDARQLGHTATGRMKELAKEDISKIATTYNAWRGINDEAYEDITGFSKIVPVEQVKENEYNLTSGFYIEERK